MQTNYGGCNVSPKTLGEVSDANAQAASIGTEEAMQEAAKAERELEESQEKASKKAKKGESNDD